nr:hypothetical protein [Tanacetum cinerariifolium]
MIEFPKSQPKRTYNEDLECEIVMVKMPKCMAWLDDEPIGDLDTMEDKAKNPSPQSTPQVLISFEVYTPPVTHPEDVEETIGIPMEVEPLDHMKLENLSLNTNTHDLFLNSKGFYSVKPQLLPNFSPLDVNLGDKRGTDPPINPYSLGSFRVKVVKPLTIHTLPSPHVAYFHQNVVFVFDYMLYLMRRSWEVLWKFHWMILGGRFNQLSHVSSPLLSKPGEY